MFDNLREDANSTPFYEDEALFEEAERENPRQRKAVRREAALTPGRFLGLTPLQRFVLAFMLLMAVCALGAMFLMVTGRISLF
ncbi:MAG: hypothetical protein ACM3MF_00185 [Anaerolineae bacterium]